MQTLRFILFPFVTFVLCTAKYVLLLSSCSSMNCIAATIRDRETIRLPFSFPLWILEMTTVLHRVEGRIHCLEARELRLDLLSEENSSHGAKFMASASSIFICLAVSGDPLRVVTRWNYVVNNEDVKANNLATTSLLFFTPVIFSTLVHMLSISYLPFIIQYNLNNDIYYHMRFHFRLHIIQATRCFKSHCA